MYSKIFYGKIKPSAFYFLSKYTNFDHRIYRDTTRVIWLKNQKLVWNIPDNKPNEHLLIHRKGMVCANTVRVEPKRWLHSH